MNTTGKVVAGVAALVVVGAGLYFAFGKAGAASATCKGTRFAAHAGMQYAILTCEDAGETRYRARILVAKDAPVESPQAWATEAEALAWVRATIVALYKADPLAVCRRMAQLINAQSGIAVDEAMIQQCVAETQAHPEQFQVVAACIGEVETAEALAGCLLANQGMFEP